MYDMSDLELITWIEKRFGLTKRIDGTVSADKIESVESELLGILNKYKTQFGISSPIPKISMRIINDKISFMFFDKRSGKRVLLGDWLANKEEYYEH